MPDMAVTRSLRRVADIDLALDAFRALLPAHGFKLVLPPPPIAGRSGRAFASVWRPGEAQVVSHEAITAGQALLLAVECESGKLQDAWAFAACRRCRGHGWFVTNNATVEICRHAEKTVPAAG